MIQKWVRKFFPLGFVFWLRLSSLGVFAHHDKFSILQNIEVMWRLKPNLFEYLADVIEISSIHISGISIVHICRNCLIELNAYQWRLIIPYIHKFMISFIQIFICILCSIKEYDMRSPKGIQTQWRIKWKDIKARNNPNIAYLHIKSAQYWREITFICVYLIMQKSRFVHWRMH